MGAGTSATSSPFDVFSEWPKEKIEQVIDEYKQKDYDFGIDAATTSMLLGVDLQVSKDIISKMSRSDTGIINALSLISGIIIMSNPIENPERFKLVFDVFDFAESMAILQAGVRIGLRPGPTRTTTEALRVRNRQGYDRQ